jgi:hypothetical protein
MAAIVAADVVGYSSLVGRDESGTVAHLRRIGIAKVSKSAYVSLANPDGVHDYQAELTERRGGAV